MSRVIEAPKTHKQWQRLKERLTEIHASHNEQLAQLEAECLEALARAEAEYEAALLKDDDDDVRFP